MQENDSKDLIKFLLGEMNNELKHLELENNNNINDNPFPFNADQTNKFQILNDFKKLMKKQNKSIISNNFLYFNRK